LATTHDGTMRRIIVRFGDAQDQAGHGRFLLLRFLIT
jgi:hypothetical protein